MDPISALSLAVNIIDLTSKALKGAATVIEVYKSADGLSRNNKTISREADSLGDIVAHLQGIQSHATYGNADRNMRETAATLISRCTDLKSVIDGCRSSQRWSYLSAGNASLKLLRKAGTIEQLQKDITSLQGQLFNWVAASTRTDVANILQQLRAISQTNCEIQSTLNIVNDQLCVGVGDVHSPTRNGTAAHLDAIRQVVADRVILQLLDFPSLETRFEDVVTQEEGTFEWVFTNPTAIFEKEPQLSTTFPDWLKSGDGIFHICGKPGSGKSTLMKYICCHDDTKELLAKWADGDELLVAKFFFWRVGPVQEQKNTRGLIRSLLHQILNKAPKLAREIFSRETRDRLVDGLQRNAGARLESEEIIGAFSRLVEVCASSTPLQDLRNIRICLFIDGLDEFDNTKINQSYRELVEKLCKWTSNSNAHVKICVSSRIEEPFMEMLDKRKRIAVHNLTRGDIELFVKNSLECHPKFQKHQQKSPDDCENLICDIRQSANGVFLWVALVLKDLNDALDNGVPIKRLKMILREIPESLNALLDRIMNRINKKYRHGVEVLLSMLLRSNGTLLSPEEMGSEYTYWLGESNKQLTFSALSCFLVLRAADLNIPFREDITMIDFELDKEEWLLHDTTNDEIVSSVGNILRTRCKGLIDIVNNKVKFMHRSIPEFLHTYFTGGGALRRRTDHQTTVVMAWTFLVDHTLGIMNEQEMSLYSFLCSKQLIKAGPNFSYRRSKRKIQWYLLTYILRQMKLGDEWEDLFRILDCIRKIILRPDYRDDRLGEFVLDCASAGLHEFIDWLFREDIIADNTAKAFILMASIEHYQEGSWVFTPAILKSCFAHGVDGRMVFPPDSDLELEGQPIWFFFLTRLRVGLYEGNRDLDAKKARIIELWLKNGADSHVRFRLLEGTYHSGRIRISSAMNSLEYVDTDNRVNIYQHCINPDFIGDEAQEVSLRDIVLRWKPYNESELLELLKDDAPDDTPGAQGRSNNEPDSTETDNNNNEGRTTPEKAAPRLEDVDWETSAKENSSMARLNRWLYGWEVQIPTRVPIHIAIIGMLGLVVAYLIYPLYLNRYQKQPY